MASTYTSNLELEKQGAGENAGTWGDPILNQNVIDRVDARIGSTTEVALSSSNVSLTQSQSRSACLKLTGTLSGSVAVSLPLSVNSVGSATAVGGVWAIDNQCTGNFTVTIKTLATGSTGVVVPQGVRSTVYSNTVNVTFADDRLGSTDIARVPSNAGSPNGSVTGVAGTAYKPASLVLDRTNKILYAGPTADGNTGWVAQSGYFPFPQGRLTPVSGSPVISTDSTSATSVYYTPYDGNLIPIYDGSWLQPYFFSEMTLTLNSSQAANQIYDVFAFLDSGTLRIGTGPAWSTATAGSGARGTGAGTTQLSRVNGLLTNAVSMTARNGAGTYAVSANQGTYLGSLYMDGTNGQVSCTVSWGQSRKWGIWNAYNRVPITLLIGDSTASWTVNSTSYRAANSNTANSGTLFSGLSEEAAQCDLIQNLQDRTGQSITIAVGWNSTSAASGVTGVVSPDSANVSVDLNSTVAKYYAPPFLGINVATCLEKGSSASNSGSGAGTNPNMQLALTWRG